MKKLLPVDVIKAGIKLSAASVNLDGYKRRDGKWYQLYKIIEADNETKITFNYNMMHEWFSVKVSLPKLVCGTNARNVYVNSADDFIYLINTYLVADGIYVDFAMFKVSLLELSHNYVCSTVEDKKYYIEYFSGKSIVRKKKQTYENSVVFKNKTSRTTIYSKSDEMESKNGTVVTHPILKRVLRVEHKLHPRGVRKYFKKRSVKDVLFADNLIDIFLKENKSAGLHLQVLHKSLFYKILINQIASKTNSFQKKVLDFYIKLNKYGISYAEARYSKYQVKKYKQIMESAGYSTTYICKSVTPVDFMDLYTEVGLNLNIEEKTRMMKKTKKEKTTFMSKAKNVFSLCLSCNFLKKACKFAGEIFNKFSNTS